MKKLQYQLSLPVSILCEGDSFVAYSPALDLSTVGETFEQAKARFDEAVQIFFEEISEKGTLNEVLNELGWQKQNKCFIPPVVVSHETEKFFIPCLA